METSKSPSYVTNIQKSSLKNQFHEFFVWLKFNDLSLHCTDFFLETKNRSYCLHCLEVVEVQMEVKMMSEVVSLQVNHLWHHRDLHDLHDLQTMETIRSHFCFEKNPYNVSSNLSLSRAHFVLWSSWRLWRSWWLYSWGCGGRTLPINSAAIAAVAAAGSLSKNWVFFFINWGSWRLWRSWRLYSGGCGGHGGRTLPYITYIKSGKSYHFVNGSIAHLQSIGLRSERGGFESRRRRCHFLGSYAQKYKFLFINWGLWWL